MRAIAANIAAWSVCVLVTTVSLAKMDEPIEMLLGGADSRGPKEPCIRYRPGSPNRRGTIRRYVPENP